MKRTGHGEALVFILLLCTTAGCQARGGLQEALRAHDVSAVQRLLKQGVDPNAADGRRDTPLHVAAMLGHGEELVDLLIGHGAQVNATNHQGWTPLHRVLDKKVAEVLLDHGADINARDKDGLTPLHIAVGTEHGRVTEYDVGDEGTDNAVRRRVADMYALRHRDLVQLLLERGADVEAKDSSGRTPLHLAARAGHMDDVRALVTQGADLNARDVYGITPLKYAEMAGQSEVAEFLRSL